MNILIVNNTLLGGGAEKLIRDMAPEYKKLGHECTVLILTKENEKYMAYLQNNNVHVEVFPEHTNHLKKLGFCTVI